VPPVAPNAPQEPEADVASDLGKTAERALQAMTDYRLAETALQRSDLKMAERLAAKAAESEPDQVEYAALLVWIRAAKATSAAGTVEAIDALRALLEKDPANERVLLYRGRLYKRAGKLREALRDFDAILAANPRHAEAASEARLIRSRKK